MVEMPQSKLLARCLLLIIIFGGFVISSCQGSTSDAQTLASFGIIEYPINPPPDPPDEPDVVTYFRCSFSTEGPEGYKVDQPWIREEPCGYLPEKGTWHWVNCGEDWGTLRIVDDLVESGRYCLEMSLTASGTRPLSSNQHIKLYEVQGRESENYGAQYTTTKEAYYQMKYWFPSNFKVEDNSWRLIWQICGEEGVYGNSQHTYSPQIALVFGSTSLYLKNTAYYYADGQERSFEVIKNQHIPKERWVPITVYFKQGSTFQSEDGTIIIWIDGAKVFERHDLSTATFSGTPYVIWGIGNYGGSYESQGQSIYIKDVIVTSDYVV